MSSHVLDALPGDILVTDPDVLIAYRADQAPTSPNGATAAAARKKAERKAAQEEAAHVKAECALREHPALGRRLRQTGSGRLALDKAKITAEARLDGKYLLSTSDPDLSRRRRAGLQQPAGNRGAIRDLKSTIELRPAFPKIYLAASNPASRAHLLLC